MKSIKPGRGPSFMGGVISVALIVFGIFWTAMAASMGAPFFFPIFGVVFIAVGIAQAVYNFKNATGKNRFSSFDITDDTEEPDPLNQRFHPRDSAQSEASGEPGAAGYCPYCGAATASDHLFCRKCGRKIV